jgi:hypothetical protein
MSCSRMNGSDPEDMSKCDEGDCQATLFTCCHVNAHKSADDESPFHDGA